MVISVLKDVTMEFIGAMTPVILVIGMYLIVSKTSKTQVK